MTTPVTNDWVCSGCLAGDVIPGICRTLDFCYGQDPSALEFVANYGKSASRAVSDASAETLEPGSLSNSRIAISSSDSVPSTG